MYVKIAMVINTARIPTEQIQRVMKRLDKWISYMFLLIDEKVAVKLNNFHVERVCVI